MSLSVQLSHHLKSVLLEVDFTVEGGVTALFGPSGAGKTSVINAISGLMIPDHGRIMIGEQVVYDSATGKNTPPHKREIGYVFQEPRLFPHLTVLQNLRFARRGQAASQDRIVELLGLGALLKRRPATLSGGEKQRVAIGRAVLSNPKLLLMDEPLSALDTQRRQEILPYLMSLRDHLHLPIIYVSHAVEEVMQLADTVVLMEQGKMQSIGTPAALLSDLTHAKTCGDAVTTIPGHLIHSNDGQMHIETPLGDLHLPGGLTAGDGLVRISINAKDILIVLQEPDQHSALLSPKGQVQSVQDMGTDVMEITLDCADTTLLAHISKSAAGRLALKPGVGVTALVLNAALA